MNRAFYSLGMWNRYKMGLKSIFAENGQRILAEFWYDLIFRDADCSYGAECEFMLSRSVGGALPLEKRKEGEKIPASGVI
jgi:hypothetical protein